MEYEAVTHTDFLVEETERQLQAFKVKVDAMVDSLDKQASAKMREAFQVLLRGDTGARDRLCDEASALIRKRDALREEWREALIECAKNFERAGLVKFDAGFFTAARARMIAKPELAMIIQPSGNA